MKKKYIVILILLIGAGVLVAKRWNAWFENPAEAAYVTPGHQDRIILSHGENSLTSRWISWRCDSVLRNSSVEVARNGSGDTSFIPVAGSVVTSRSGRSAFYKVELTDLLPGADYSYRLVNDTTISSWYTFSLPEEEEQLSFLYIGDVQDPLEGESARWFKQINEAYPHVDFWAFGGDVIERPTDVFWNYWFQTMDSITPVKPIVVATGNHEYLKGIPKSIDPRWVHTFVNPTNGPEGFKGQSYFLNFNDLCFIVLDSDGIQGPLSLYRHYDWLKNILATTDKKWKIVMMHHPIHSVRDGRNNFFFRFAFKPLYEEFGVNLVLQGHDHGYSRIATKTADQGLQCPVYLVSSCSRKHYPVGFGPEHDRLGANLSLYQYITLRGDSLHLQAFTVDDNQLYDDIVIVNDGHHNVVTDRAVAIPEQLEMPDSYQKKGQKAVDEYLRHVEERRQSK